jgi:hypothetical protein
MVIDENILVVSSQHSLDIWPKPAGHGRPVVPAFWPAIRCWGKIKTILNIKRANPPGSVMVSLSIQILRPSPVCLCAAPRVSP